MNFKTYRTLLYLLLPGSLLVGCSPAKNTVSTPNKSSVIFFDDFSGDKLDRAKWNVEIPDMHFNNELQAYVDSPVTIFMVKGADAEGATNGALMLKPVSSPGYKAKDGQVFDFISTRLNTRSKFDFLYGTAEARIKVTNGPGLWPAWWMLGNGNWPDDGEIDIMEYVGEKDWASAAVHGPGYSGETPFVNRQYFDANNDATQWHIYAVEWTPDVLNFIYDGKLMFRVTRKMAEHYGKWAFDTKKFLLLNYALGGAYPVKINGEKKPYFGLTPASAELVKEGKAKMLVDWVRVSRNQ